MRNNGGMLRQKWLKFFVLSICGIVSVWPVSVFAQAASSTHYSVNEVFFGSGGAINACSTSYCSNQSLGELSVGNPSSPNYQIHAGFNTTQQPYLYFTVTSSTTDLGYLSTSSTATSTGAFSVRTYQAGGYIVQTVSNPPTSTEGHTLSTPATPTSSATGTEQFGMNLVANTSPTTFGTNPVDNPASGSAVGIAATNYNTANKFMYHAGDTIASSTTPGDTTGEADYTISYIFNISPSTPAGQYNFNDILVATATY
jgi:hypothetical protein